MKICYFGIYNPDFSRNKIYINGLRKNGVEVIECRANTRGYLKYWKLFLKHWKIRDAYDALIVGYPGHIVVPLAKIISKKIVVADLLGSLEDAEVNSHDPSLFKKIKAKLADWLAVIFADIILLESEAQKEFFIKKFGKKYKYRVVYTGASEEFIRKSGYSLGGSSTEEENKKFKVLFRGRLTPESGIGYILKSAQILKKEDKISFLVLGGGQLLSFAGKEIRENNLTNVELVSKFLSYEELIGLIKKSDSDLSLGQIENNPRLNRTIPHKAFESFALGIPYLTGDAPAIRELITEGETGFLTPLVDSEKLAERINELSVNKDLLQKVSRNAQKMFNEKLAPSILAKQIIDIIS